MSKRLLNVYIKNLKSLYCRVEHINNDLTLLDNAYSEWDQPPVEMRPLDSITIKV